MAKTFMDHQQIQKEMVIRLKKIEGQVRGVTKMIQEGRGCGDVVIQLGAIKAAVNKVGFTVLACHLAGSIEEELNEHGDMNHVLGDFLSILKKFS
jgi:DNA-binding FrmR family transcriptional regulator